MTEDMVELLVFKITETMSEEKKKEFFTRLKPVRLELAFVWTIIKCFPLNNTTCSQIYERFSFENMTAEELKEQALLNRYAVVDRDTTAKKPVE